MCDSNENNIISLDFSLTQDENNWQTTSTNPLQTVGGKLVLKASSNDSEFIRLLGGMDVSNNRLNVKSNIFITNDVQTLSNVEILFELLEGNNVIDTICIPISNIERGEEYSHFLDVNFNIRTSNQLSLRVTIPEGWQNTIMLSDLEANDFNFCLDNNRTYFVIDGLLEDSLSAMSSAIELKEWKIDGVETLTPIFFLENNNVGGNPLSQWFFAKADLDGKNRVSENVTPNTFNPFSDEFGLEFDNVSSFYGGKPLGAISGSDYGVGVINIGLDKPTVLNGLLETKKGAFFIDINYEEDLKVVFNVLSNQSSSNVFNNPSYYRQYTIEWDSKRCEESFTYIDFITGDSHDEISNGFLSGTSGIEVVSTVVACDESFSPSGQSGNFTYDLDFGSDVGTVGIEYNAYSVPDRFIIEYDGQVYDTGFVGSSSYNQQLLDAAGVDPADINTGNPSTGSGSITFSKPNSQPTKAKVTVLAPLGSTGWSVKGICTSAGTPPIVDISANDTILEVGQLVTVTATASDPDGSIASWVLTYGDGSTESGSGVPPSTFTHTYNAVGNRQIELTVTDNDGFTSKDTIFLTVNQQQTPVGSIVCTNECIDPSGVSQGVSCWEIEINAPLDAGYKFEMRRFSIDAGGTFSSESECNGCNFNVDRHETLTFFQSPFNSNLWPNKTASFGLKTYTSGFGTVYSWRVRVLDPNDNIIDEKTFERIG